MYNELRSALDWEERISTMAREYGQKIGSRRLLCVFGPRYLTYLFSPQARRLEPDLRHYGNSQRAEFPDGWKTGWPGRDQERLYFILEELSAQNPSLQREAVLENTRAGIFQWSAGPLEVDLIVPKQHHLDWMDPRLRSLENLTSLVIARIGSRTEQPMMRAMNLPESIQVIKETISKVEASLGVHSSLPSDRVEVASPGISPQQVPTRRDAWIKA